MKSNLASKLTLYAVTDRTWLGSDKLSDQVLSAIEGGVSFVQIREKNISDEEYIRRALEVKKVTDKYAVPFVVNDNVDVAFAVDADGVHLGQDDEDIKIARLKLGEDKIIGATAHNLKEALAAEKAGADYLGVGACFTTSTKDNTVPISYDELKKICEQVHIPVVAIAGINENNIEKLKGSGIDGVAVVSAIFAAKDKKIAAKNLRDKMRGLYGSSCEEMLEHIKMHENDKKAMIFDMDGTLLDSMGMWEFFASNYVRSKGKVPKDTLDKDIVTMSISIAAEFIKKEYDLPIMPEEIMDEVNDQVAQKYYNELLLKSQSLYLVEKLKSMGYQVAIATATEEDLASAALKRNGLGTYLDDIVSCGMAGTGKDKPDVYDMTARRLGVDKSDVIIFEDNIDAMRTAKAAGYKVYAVYDRTSKCQWSDIEDITDWQVRLDG